MATGKGAKTAKQATTTKQVVPLPQKRLRFHRLLPDPRVDTTQMWSKSQPALKGKTDAETVVDLWESNAFQQTVLPYLERVEVERADRQRRKRKFLYTVAEVEKVMMFKAITGCNDMTEVRTALTGENPEPRRTLGLDRPRNIGRKMTMMDGVPSLPTLCRHRQLFDPKERAEVWRSCFELARDEHIAEFPVEMLDEIGLLAMDGAKIEVKGICPIYKKGDKEKKNPINRAKVTVWDGGYVPPSAGPDHSGHGFNNVTVATAKRLPLDFVVTPLNDSERIEGGSLVERTGVEVLSQFPDRGLGLLSADGGFWGNRLSIASRQARLVEHAHNASHADTPSIRRRVDKLRKERFRIKVKAKWMNWKADGLYQLHCNCGQGIVRPRYGIGADGGAILGVEGACKNCGPISITSGQWRKTTGNNKHWVKVNPADPSEKPDYSMGNPLTYDRPESRAYGNLRRAHQEGLNSVIATRMGLTTGKRRYRTIQDARADVAIAYSLAHVLTMITRRAEAEARTTAPPAQLAA